MTLTPREVQIVRLIADGKEDKEIARALKISIHTVNTHMRRMFAKVGTDNRVSLVLAALARGYLHVEPIEDDEDFPGVRVTGCADNDEDDD